MTRRAGGTLAALACALVILSSCSQPPLPPSRIGLIRGRDNRPFAIRTGTCSGESITRIVVTRPKEASGAAGQILWEVDASGSDPYNGMFNNGFSTGHIIEVGDIQPGFEEKQAPAFEIPSNAKLELTVETSRGDASKMRFTLDDLKGIGDRVLVATHPSRYMSGEEFDNQSTPACKG